VASAADLAYAALRAGILQGEWASGARLGEVELAGTLGMSRTPIREALRRLESEGLVEVLANRGARVASWTTEDLDEIYELRALLESHGTARAATRMDLTTIEQLRELCDEMEIVGEPGPDQDLDRVADLNRRFHGAIITASASVRLAALLGTVVQLPLVLRTFHRYSDEALRRSFGHHRELVAAFEAGDSGWAQAVMSSHVLHARAVLVGARSAPGRQGRQNLALILGESATGRDAAAAPDDEAS
jgi:DNA-binding GntR family transcriptional regulator